MAEPSRRPPAADGQPSRIAVEVAYALPERQELITVEIDDGATVLQAIERSGILTRFPDIELAPGRVGVFGKPRDLGSPLRDGDRVEIYRPLAADPRRERRVRARKRRA